ncbi:MAG: hypothetical protein IPM74_07570 [Crocinitomicaceae bacterium]|nr:hypothetical protein [Crocinitomicaceae bacterium]
MPKYRLLTNNEQKEFEKEFVSFLVVNGIEPERWEQIKAEDQPSVDKIIELFSDVILESVLRNVKFIEIKSKRYVQAIQCLPDKMIAVALEDKGDENQKSGSEEERENSLSLYRSEKNYALTRELEIFDMLQKGYVISNGDLFRKLDQAGH